LHAANSWHRCIVVKCTGSGTQVDYLDLDISIVNNSGHGRISYQLFRKPLNIYQYLPRSSCHPESVFGSVIHSEATRILRRCESHPVAQQQLQFFRSKLISRGYSDFEISKQFRTARLRHLKRNREATRCTPGSHVRKAFLKVMYSHSTDLTCIRRCLSQHSHLVPNTKVICATTVQKSIFRLLYPFMWRRQT